MAGAFCRLYLRANCDWCFAAGINARACLCFHLRDVDALWSWPGTVPLATPRPGLLWVIMLMAVLLSLDRMFQADFEDGGLDQLMLLPVALEGAVMAKLAPFCRNLLPVLATMPLAGLLLNIAPIR